MAGDRHASLLVTTDFNRDGKMDIAVANQTDGTIAILLGDGKGSFTQAPGSPIEAKGVMAIAAGDFNGDGIVDLVASGVVTESSPGSGIYGNNTETLLGDGTGAFFPGKYSSEVFVYGQRVVTGDFNGDGKLDAVVMCCGGAWLLPGNGAGGFASPLETLLNNSAYVTDIAAADFNGDGKLDLASVDTFQQGNAWIRFGDGGGRFPNFANYTIPIAGTDFGDQCEPLLSLGGFEGLGTQILTCVEGSVVTLSWNGAYAYGNDFNAVTSPKIAFPIALAVADFNGDGKLDWAGAYSDGTARVFLGDGTGRFAPEGGGPYTAGGSAWDIAAADFNGDGKPDLAVYTGTSIAVLLNTGAAGPQPQTIQFTSLSNVTYSTPPFSITATASSTLAVSFASSTPLVCTVSGNLVTILSVGTCSITATQAGNSLYNPAPPVTQSFTVRQATQSITFYQPLDQSTANPPLTLNATASSGLAISYTAQPSSVCTVSGATLTPVGAGICSVTAAQSGNANYIPAASVTVTFNVFVTGKTPQVISFPGPQTFAVGQTITLGDLASASSNLALIFTSNTPGVCTVSGGFATLVATGTCSITATQPGNAAYAAAAPVTQTITVTLESQAIFWPALPVQQTVGGAFTLNASANSFLTVASVSNTPSVCTVSGNTVNLIAVGTCSITASQGGNSKYAAAQPVTQTFAVVSPSLQSQTIAFGPLSGRTLGTGTFTVSATASSALAVTFLSATPAVCTVSGNAVTLLTSGTCTITASQGGNATYNAAPPVSQSFTVSAAALTQQTITFASVATAALSAGTVTVSATASSGMPVVFTSSTPAVCIVSGTTVTLLAAGTCTIAGSQAGNGVYAPASATQSFLVTSGQPGPSIDRVTNAASYAAGTVAPGSYAILFGANLAAQAGDPSVAVSITDAAGNRTPASITYVGTGQVNIFIPSSVALGGGNVTLTNSVGNATFEGITIANISPGLFTVDAAGTIPAAQVVTTASDGSQVAEGVANCTAGGCALAPIVLTPGTPAYLILYGTGLRGTGNTSYVSVMIGGVPATVEYAGPQGGYPGLDQVNVLIPPSLAGQGQVSLQLGIFTTQANPVQLLFQ